MSWITVTDFNSNGWADSSESTARQLCSSLESGDILFFSECPFSFPESHRQKLLEHRQSGFRYHKNVSYQPLKKKLRGLTTETEEDHRELVQIMDDYSSQVIEFVNRFLIPYRGHYQVDYASYRPVEEAGRKMTLHKRNDLLHVDAFPNRPTRGGRILRVFTNVNPQKPRIWNTTEGFDRLAHQYAEEAGLSKFAHRGESAFWKLIYGASSLPKKLFGNLRQSPSTYDRFMHQFHNYLKENEAFQKDCDKTIHEFPPGSTWLVYTDYVPHAVLSGQFALEQTFIIGLEGMVTPQQAPLRILEQICGKKLAA